MKKNQIAIEDAQLNARISNAFNMMLAAARNVTYGSGLIWDTNNLVSLPLMVRPYYRYGADKPNEIEGYYYRHSMTFSAKCGEITVLVTPPRSAMGDEQFAWINNADDLSAMEAYSKSCRIPFDWKDPKSGIQFRTSDRRLVSASDPDSDWTPFAKPVSAINQWLKILNIEPLTTAEGNAFLCEVDTIIKAAAYYCRFTARNISDEYSEEDDDANEYISCMAGAESGYFELYDYLQRDGKLEMIGLYDSDDIRRGRALCWRSNGQLYIDRLYLPTSNGEFRKRALEAVRSFCEENGITKTVYERTASLLGLTKVNLAISVGLEPDNFYQFPYVDSMCNYCSDLKIRNHSNLPSGVWSYGDMQNTDGSASFSDEMGEDYVTLANGERCHQDDACYVESRGEWYRDSDCVLTHAGEWELMDDCYELCRHHYRRLSYRYALSDDVVEDIHGNFILSDDAICLYDGNYIHCDEDHVKLHDGTYALSDDAVELADGSYALTEDAVETDDGWVLASSIETQTETQNA